VDEDRRLAVTAPLPVSTWAFVAVCAMAGALAVPVDAIASPVSTFVAGLTGLLGLQLWRWSRLLALLRAQASTGFQRIGRPAAWMGLGLELVFRLLLLSLVAGLATRVLRRAGSVPSPAVARGAIALSAVAFAAVHLPAWSAAGPLSLGLALMVITLNGLGGVVFGYVFVTRGIMAAMWAHAGADCAIQLIGPLTR